MNHANFDQNNSIKKMRKISVIIRMIQILINSIKPGKNYINNLNKK